MKRRPSGWEWVGVIAIVLVVAVLSPIFLPRPHGGRLHSCLSGQKQLGLGLLQYADNYDGLVPPVTQDAENTWRVAVYPQVRMNSAYKCPEDDRTSAPDGHFPSYAMNIGATVPAPGAKPQPPSYAPDYQRLVLLCEIQNTDDAALSIDDPLRFSPDKHILAMRHSGGSNYLLSDGHAKWFRPSAFMEMKPLVRWYRDPKRPLSANAQAVLKAAP